MFSSIFKKQGQIRIPQKILKVVSPLVFLQQEHFQQIIQKALPLLGRFDRK